MTATPKLDLTKPVQTLDGWPVRILCQNRKPSSWSGLVDDTVVGLIDFGKDGEQAHTWTPDGRYNNGEKDHVYDLVNVPEKPKEVVRVAIMTNGGICFQNQTSIDEAKKANPTALGFKIVTITEGDGM